jgi:hypothetical protein
MTVSRFLLDLGFVLMGLVLALAVAVEFALWTTGGPRRGGRRRRR